MEIQVTIPNTNGAEKTNFTIPVETWVKMLERTRDLFGSCNKFGEVDLKTPISKKRKLTKVLLSGKFVAKTSLPMWLADIAVEFDPDDASFYETKLKPILLKRCNGKSLSVYTQQLNALRRFLLTNFKTLVSDEFKQNLEAKMCEPNDNIASQLLTRIHFVLANPTELHKLWKFHSRGERPGYVSSAVTTWFSNQTIFKPSFNNIFCKETSQ
jgi:hypothetical protein